VKTVGDVMSNTADEYGMLRDALSKMASTNLKIQILGSILTDTNEHEIIEKISQRTSQLFVDKMVDYGNPNKRITEMASHIEYLEKVLNDNKIWFSSWEFRK